MLTPVPGDLTIDPLDPNGPDLCEWLGAARLVFLNREEVTEELTDSLRRLFAGHRLLAARDGDRIVATFRTWPTGVTLPGTGAGAGTGAAPGTTIQGLAVSSVTVLPTHRRRGLLTRMMSAELDAAHADGLALAVLLASEATIYGRFGYGAATRSATWTLDVPRARAAGPALAGNARAGGPTSAARARSAAHLEYCDAAALRAVAPGVAEASRGVGTIDRSDAHWDRALGIEPPPAADKPKPVNVVHRDGDGKVTGYLRYLPHDEWEGRTIRSRVELLDLQAVDDAAAAALWRFLLDLDLVATVVAEERRVDEPLPWLVADPRALAMGGPMDFLWVRVLDPVQLLSARGYPGVRDGELVLEVDDPAGYAAGRFVLRVEDGHGRCTRTDRAPELAVDVDVLGSICLGDGGLVGAATAGRTRPLVPGAVERADALLRTPAAPWTNLGF